MGFLRLLLAISVITAHVPGESFRFGTGSDLSVQCFYILSGFFITMILNEKYTSPRDNLLFYTNRLIRIFSLYWFFLIMAAVVAAVAYFAAHKGVFAVWADNYSRLSVLDIIYFIVTHLLLIGQDLTTFLRLTNTGMTWTSHFLDYTPNTTQFMILAPAWTLSLELCFYALAPFIVRKNLKTVVAIIGISLGLRIAGYLFGLQSDPWTYRFFPFELALFLAGAVSYHIYKTVRARALSQMEIILGWLIIIVVLACPWLVSNHATFFEPARMGILIYVIIALPFLFRHTQNMAFDRMAGNLSYPIYLCHMIFVQLFQGVSSLAPHPHLRAIMIILCSLICSYGVMQVIEIPIDRFRQARVKAHLGNLKY